jgi:hypothetical protein
VPDSPTTPPAPEPDDRDPVTSYVTEDEVRGLGIDPDLVRVLCPWAVELTGYGGVRCWAAADVRPLLEGGAR